MTDILNLQEAATLLDCEVSTLNNKASQKELPAVRLGRSWVFPRAALVEHLNQQAKLNLERGAMPTQAVVMRAAKQTRKAPALPALK